jgi:hypothetical protein
VEQPIVSVLHPSLQDFLLATYVAAMTDEEQAACLERHRWFDVAWQGIFALSMPLLSAPGDLIERIMDTADDPWYTQAVFAASCAAEAPGRIPGPVAKRLVSTLLDSGPGIRPTDTERCATAFNDLVRANMPAAVDRGLAILEQGFEAGAERYLAVVCAFADSRREEGLAHARQLLPDNRVRHRHRAHLVTALATTEQTESLNAIATLLDESSRRSDLDGLLAALRPQSSASLALAVRLLRSHKLRVDVRTAIAAALIECGTAPTRDVLDTAREPTMELAVRCRLLHMLVIAGEAIPESDASEMVGNPGVQLVDRAYVVEAMLRLGRPAWLQQAALMVGDLRIPWSRREALAGAMRDLGAPGMTVLVACLRSWDLETALLCLYVLMKAREPGSLEFALRVLEQDGITPSRKRWILLTLLDTAPDVVPVATATRLCRDPKLTVTARMPIAVGLAKVDGAEVFPLVRDLLAEPAECNWVFHSRQMALAGTNGQSVLARLGKDSGLPWEIRTESLVALGSVEAADARRVVSTIDLDGIPKVWLNRLSYSLTAAGNPQFVMEIANMSDTSLGAYETIRAFMLTPTASLEIFYAVRSRVSQPHVESDNLLKIDDDLLRDLGLSWNSEGEREWIHRWFFAKLQERFGARLVTLQPRDKVDELLREIEDDDEESTLRILAISFPIYQEFLQFEFEEFKHAVRDGLRPPSFQPRDSSPAEILPMIANAVALLREWMKLTTAHDWARAVNFLMANRAALTSELCRGCAVHSGKSGQGLVLSRSPLNHPATCRGDATRRDPANFDRRRDRSRILGGPLGQVPIPEP